MAGTRRYTLDMGEKFDGLLQDLANAKETTKSEIIRRAVASYAYFSDEVSAGRKVAVSDGNGNIVKEVVLP